MSELNQDPETGQFLPGHTWKAPPWKPGKSGHTARYTPGRLRTVCTEYIEQQAINDKPLTWSGLAWFMGISRQALTRYYKGDIGLDKPGIVHTLEIMRTAIEAQREEMLVNKDYATAGVIAALRSQDPDTWGDKAQAQQANTPSIRVILAPGPLTDRLEQHGVQVQQTIEHES